jgi:DNA-binding transcriptional LysR family regulator
MAQPSLSEQIRRLEAELGVELFRRSSREVALTEAGRVLLDGARRTLAEAERAVTATRRAGAGAIGSVRIGFSWSARFETLPALGRAFNARQPDVELLTWEMWNARMIDALRAGTIDAAIAVCPEVGDGVAYATIRTEPVVAVLAASHVLAVKGPIGLDALADESFVLFPREYAPRLYDRLVGLCRTAGFEPAVRRESFHAGWSWACSPKQAWSRWPRRPSRAASPAGSSGSRCAIPSSSTPRSSRDRTIPRRRSRFSWRSRPGRPYAIRLAPDAIRSAQRPRVP